MAQKKSKYYVVWKGEQPGIYLNWTDCKAQVSGHAGAKYKAFDSQEEAEFEDVLVSTGGGTPCFFDNMAFMRQQGTTIYLQVSVEELAKRLELCKQTRPVLKNRSGEELKDFVQDSLATRTSFYEQAQIIFNADRLMTEVDAKELSAQILQLLK